jgi:hypothetical protein
MNIPTEIINILGESSNHITNIQKIDRYNYIFNIFESYYTYMRRENLVQYLKNDELVKMRDEGYGMGYLYVCDDLNTFLLPYDNLDTNNLNNDKFDIIYYETDKEYYLVLKYSKEKFLEILKTLKEKKFIFGNNNGDILL